MIVKYCEIARDPSTKDVSEQRLWRWVDHVERVQVMSETTGWSAEDLHSDATFRHDVTVGIEDGKMGRTVWLDLAGDRGYDRLSLGPWSICYVLSDDGKTIDRLT